MNDAKGMLVAVPERWDEACFAVPALRALVASGMGVGVLCQESQRGFWETVGGLTVLGFPVAKARSAAANITGSWQASLAWEPGGTAGAFKIAGIPRRLGPDGRKMRKLLTHPLNFSAGPLEHRVRYYLSAVEELGIATGQPEFFAPAAIGIEPEPDAVLLCPGSDFGPNHEWAIERWEELAGKISASGRRVTVAGEDGGRGLGGILAEKLEVERVSIVPSSEALALLARFGVIISADGSLPHLAAHAGATCVTLFGPNDPAWKRPLGRRHAVVRRHVECAPCLLPKCPLDMRCQSELDVDRVWTAVREKLDAAGG